MKATIIGQTGFVDVLDEAHGGTYISRLWIESQDNLIITIVDGHIYAYTGFDKNVEEYDVLVKSVDVPVGLVELARTLAKAQKDMDAVKDRFQSLLAKK